MEPTIITVEECDRWWVVDQRWGHDDDRSVTDSWNQEDTRFGRAFETAFIWNGSSVYEAAYRNWCRVDNRSHNKSRFLYIVEARTRKQVADAMVARGHHAMFRSKMMHPHNCEHNEENSMTFKREPWMINGQSDEYNPSWGRNLRSLQDSLLRQAAAVQAKIDFIDSLPDEPVADDGKPNVIFFQKQFTEGGRVYDYAALQAGDGKWYTTGPRTPKGFTWQALIEWINEDVPTTVSRATKFKAL